MESERIFDNLSKVSTRLFPNDSQNLNNYLTSTNKKKGIKMLSTIFN